MPKVSVVIPTYKVEKYIERCARSLFEQTLDSLEYIFVDDCSPDNSIAVMQKVLEEYPQRKDQVKVIRHEVNQGVGAARNHGVAACTGDYIIHCDPDDWVDLNMYETMYNKAIETNADMVYSDFYINTPYREKTRKTESINNKDDFLFYLCSDQAYAALWTKLYKRTICHSIPQMDEMICMNEDFIRNYYCIQHCHKIVHIPQPYYHYFLNINSISKNWHPKHLQQLLQIHDILAQDVSAGKCDKHNLMAYEQVILYMMLRHPEIITQKDFLKYKRKFLSSMFIWSHMPITKKIFLTAGMICTPLTKLILSVLIPQKA